MARACTRCPGVVDVHVHFNDPGRADWEGGATGSAALSAGGGTTFCDMPLNSSPAVIDGESFDRKHAALQNRVFADFGLWGGLVPGNVDHMAALAERGVIGFKAFMSNSGIDDFGRADDETLFAGMKKAAELGLPVAVHAEDETLTARLSAEARAAGRSSVRGLSEFPPNRSGTRSDRPRHSNGIGNRLLAAHRAHQLRRRRSPRRWPRKKRNTR